MGNDTPPDAFEISVATLDRAAARERVRATIELSRSKDPRRATVMLKLATDRAQPRTVRLVAVRSLAEMPARQSYEQLAMLLDEDDDDLAMWTARALGATGETRAAERLAELAEHPNADLRGYAVDGLERLMPDATAVRVLQRFLHDSNRSVRLQAARALSRKGPAGVADVLVLAADRERWFARKPFRLAASRAIERHK